MNSAGSLSSNGNGIVATNEPAHADRPTEELSAPDLTNKETRPIYFAANAKPNTNHRFIFFDTISQLTSYHKLFD